MMVMMGTTVGLLEMQSQQGKLALKLDCCSQVRNSIRAEP